MSIICRPKASDGDKTWVTWEDAAQFCSSSGQQYHLRVKCGDYSAGHSSKLILPAFRLAIQGKNQTKTQFNTRSLKCWCTIQPNAFVSVNGSIVGKSCPLHPCWDLGRPLVSVETILAKPIPQHPALKSLYVVNQSQLCKRYQVEGIPVLRGSAEYFAELLKEEKNNSEANYLRQGKYLA